jgi:hypothetical protein
MACKEKVLREDTAMLNRRTFAALLAGTVAGPSW